MKKILVLNRRDIRNPLSGGAEVYTHEIFRRMCGKFDITHFSSYVKGRAAEELINGIRYVRKGNELTTHLWGFIYALRNKGIYDLIIDQFNGVGFMTFGFQNSVLLIHQLYGAFWTARLGVSGIFFEAVEKTLLKLYRQKHTITVSDSTKKDLLQAGFDEKNVHTVLNGVDYMHYAKKEKFVPLVMYLGRLSDTKNPEDAIRAFLEAKKQIMSLVLYVVGDGEERRHLENKYKGRPDIKFFGYVPEEEKYRLLREASVLLVPSVREGWGQVVIQAGMTGTPSVGYNVEGLRDSIIDSRTGLLVPANDSKAMADAIVYLFDNLNVLSAMSLNAQEHAKSFSWEKSAGRMKKHISFFTHKTVSK